VPGCSDSVVSSPEICKADVSPIRLANRGTTDSGRQYSATSPNSNYFLIRTHLESTCNAQIDFASGRIAGTLVCHVA